MKKRLISVILAVCMMLCLVSAAAADGLTNVSTEAELRQALSGSSKGARLTADIALASTLEISDNANRYLDLNGHVLSLTADTGSVIYLNGSLTIKDSSPDAAHRFSVRPDGLWVLDEQNGTETVYGGIITGGKGTKKTAELGNGNSYSFVYGGGIYLEATNSRNSSLVMAGGSIVGCTAEYGGGTALKSVSTWEATLNISQSSIIGCTAKYGGAIHSSGGLVNAQYTYVADCTTTDTSSADVHLVSDISKSYLRHCDIDGSIYNSDTPEKLELLFPNTFYPDISINKKNGVRNAVFPDSCLTVTFMDGRTKYATQYLESGAAASEPVEPEGGQEGYVPQWYTDPELTTPYSFDTTVAENITLYLGWVEKPVEPEEPKKPEDEPVEQSSRVDYSYTPSRENVSVFGEAASEAVTDDANPNTGALNSGLSAVIEAVLSVLRGLVSAD